MYETVGFDIPTTTFADAAKYISILSLDFTISKDTITITATNKSAVVGNTQPELTYTVPSSTVAVLIRENGIQEVVRKSVVDSGSGHKTIVKPSDSTLQHD